MPQFAPVQSLAAARQQPSAYYRVEWRDTRHETRVLGIVTGIPLHPHSLDQYISHLLLDGLSGEVLLVNECSGTIVARRTVTPLSG